jgi:diguanylate cyclase (GGDEF)-like protein
MVRRGESETIRILVAMREGEAVSARFAAAGTRSACVPVDSVAAALEELHRERYHAILLDPGLPDAEGPATVAHLRDVAPDVAVIAVLAEADERAAISYLQAGAQDCVVRGLADEALLRAVRFALERIRTEKRLSQLAAYDPLTGLVNRPTFLHRLNRAIARARRTNKEVAILFVDLDGFKPINDAFGHAIGDALLRLVALRLGTVVRATDTVARLGGDEFAIVLEGIASSHDIACIADKVLDAIKAPAAVSGRDISISASVGIALFPGCGWEPSALLRHADAAMYRAKQSGRGGYHFFTREMTAEAAERLTMERSLRRTLERDELVLHYQPQIDPASGAVVGVEALVRWRHPDMGIVMPGRFLALAEQCGLIGPIGEWVLRTACAQFAEWQEAGLAPERLAVNLSAREIMRHAPSETVIRILKEYGLEPGVLEIELADRTFSTAAELDNADLSALIAMGVRVAIDDFGSGHFPLGSMKRFPVDTLKIDRCFVQNIEKEAWDTAIVTAVIGLGRSLGLRIVAEGVETAVQYDFLRKAGCGAIQGYLVSPPVPHEILTAWLRDRIGSEVRARARSF